MRWSKSLCPMRNDKLLQALGLSARGGKLIAGTQMICEALQKKKKNVLMVLAASDNSENTAKRLADRCAFYGVELIALPYDGDTLSGAIGKSGRVAAVAVVDESFCRLIRSAAEKTEQ